MFIIRSVKDLRNYNRQSEIYAHEVSVQIVPRTHNSQVQADCFIVFTYGFLLSIFHTHE